MFCGKCGASIPDNIAFCGKCGTKRHDKGDFKNLSKPATVASQMHNHQSSLFGTQSKSIGKKAILISTIIVLCSIGVALAIILSAKKDDNEPVVTVEHLPLAQPTIQPSSPLQPSATPYSPAGSTPFTAPLEPTLIEAAYAAYYEILTNAIDESNQPDDGNPYGLPIGVNDAALIDFDNDGLPELVFTAYADACMVYHVYAFSESAAELHFTGFSAFASTGGNTFHVAESENGRKYLVDYFTHSGSETSYHIFYTLENGEWITALHTSSEGVWENEFVTYTGEYIYYVNGESVSEQNYNNAPKVELGIESYGNVESFSKLFSNPDVVKAVLVELAEKANIEAPTSNVAGNTPGNIVNSGIAAIQGDWIYYINIGGDESLYAIRTDGTGKKKISDDTPSYINVVGDWIYYSNINDACKIYKVCIDGAGKQKLNDDYASYINVVGDRIYYHNANWSDDIGIYTIRTDGTDRKRLSDDSAEDINVIGDWIYYCNWSDGGSIYKIRTDGTDRKRLSDDSAGNINVVGDWIYYGNRSDGGIYAIQTDGMGKQKICEDQVTGINVVGDQIYYRNGIDNKLYIIRTDGSDKQKFNDEWSSNITVVGEWVLYIGASSDIDFKLYAICTDGTDRQLLSS